MLYPAASIPSDEALRGAREGWREALPAEVVSLVEGEGGSKPAVFVSVNRFEGKKGLPLALRALGALDELLLQQQVAPKETGAPAAGEPKAGAPPPPPVLHWPLGHHGCRRRAPAQSTAGSRHRAGRLETKVRGREAWRGCRKRAPAPQLWGVV